MSAAVMELPSAFVLFERRDTVDAMTKRVSELYAWADFVGVPIVEHLVAWGEDARAEHPAPLRRAVNACRLVGAALLVHAVEVVSAEGRIIGTVLGDLGPHQMWTPGGRVVINHFGDVSVIGLPATENTAFFK